MSTITMQAPVRDRSTNRISGRNETVPAVGSRPAAPSRVRPSRPGQGSGRLSGPVARGRSGVAAPELLRPSVITPASCAGEPVRVAVANPRPRPAAGRVRLTNRGIAVVLVAGAMLVVAALTVVGATALRVTSDSYQPTFSSAAR